MAACCRRRGPYEPSADEEAFVQYKLAARGAARQACRDAPPAAAAACWSSLRSRYLLANVVYAAYAFLIIYIDLVAQPAVTAAYDEAIARARELDPYDDDDYLYYYADYGGYEAKGSALYSLYKAAAVVHLVNAFMYAWAWLPTGFPLFSVVQIPELLNAIGAAIYCVTAWKYEEVGSASFDAPVTLLVHDLETAASAVELFAAIGWCLTWWLTFPRGVAGRGFTLDDPDVWGNIFIVVPSIYYVVYNARVDLDPQLYLTDTLYTNANVLFAAGSVIYLLSSLRDDGWLAFLPGGGTCAYGCDASAPIAPPAGYGAVDEERGGGAGAGAASIGESKGLLYGTSPRGAAVRAGGSAFI
jgi:hypothetical protein